MNKPPERPPNRLIWTWVKRCRVCRVRVCWKNQD